MISRFEVFKQDYLNGLGHQAAPFEGGAKLHSWWASMTCTAGMHMAHDKGFTALGATRTTACIDRVYVESRRSVSDSGFLGAPTGIAPQPSASTWVRARRSS